uniref:Uncharacterized protein n=1 Tax=Rhizophora mucronata TaxID=61149 RepID=A0A2P2PXM5_RHIMU
MLRKRIICLFVGSICDLDSLHSSGTEGK